MSFKIVILGDENAVANRLTQVLDDLPLRFTYVDKLCLVDPVRFSDVTAWLELLHSEQATIVINLLFPTTCDQADMSLPMTVAIAEACSQRNTPLIQLSSYRVFGTEYSVEGWSEVDLPFPLDDFGKQLLERERAAITVAKHIVIRLSWVLDAFDDNLLTVAIQKLTHENPSLIVSDHKYGRPISAVYIANTILALIQQILVDAQNWGVFHLHSSDLCSEAEFCDYLLRILSAELDRDIPAPEVAGKGDNRAVLQGSANLQGNKITNNFGIQLPSWRSGFKKLVKSWLSENSSPSVPTSE